MDFSYSDEQQMLADSLRRYLGAAYDFAKRRTISREGGAFDRKTWAALAEMGVLGLGIAPEFGGFGEGAASQLVVHRELGRGLVLEPVIPSSVIAAAILDIAGSPAQKAEWLPGLAAGTQVLALAYLEPQTRYRPEAAACAALAVEGGGYRLDGFKSLVWHGEAADAWLVSARLEGALSLFLVPRGSAGVQVRGYPAMDGLQGADLRFEGVKLPATALVGAPGTGLASLEHGIDHGLAAQCAAAAGAMERLVDTTVTYLGDRRQFGKPLATLQVLQHRVADMLVQKEVALSMAYVAAKALDEGDGEARRRMLSAAKAVTAKAARFVGQQAVQLHGGMGMTDELEVGDYFKYLTMVDVLLGDTDFHTERYCDAMELAEEQMKA